jgi:hypothetical protein
MPLGGVRWAWDVELVIFGGGDGAGIGSGIVGVVFEAIFVVGLRWGWRGWRG